MLAGFQAEPDFGDRIEIVKENTNQFLLQLSWVDINIYAEPPTGRCANKSGQITAKKIIIDNVSGCVMPG